MLLDISRRDSTVVEEEIAAVAAGAAAGKTEVGEEITTIDENQNQI